MLTVYGTPKEKTDIDKLERVQKRAAQLSAGMIEAGMRGKGVIVLHNYRDQLW